MTTLQTILWTYAVCEPIVIITCVQEYRLHRGETERFDGPHMLRGTAILLLAPLVLASVFARVLWSMMVHGRLP